MKYQELALDVLLCAFVTKALVITPTWPECSIIFAICLAIAIKQYHKEHQKIKAFEAKMLKYDTDVAALNQRIQDVSNNMGKISLNNIGRLGK